MRIFKFTQKIKTLPLNRDNGLTLSPPIFFYVLGAMTPHLEKQYYYDISARYQKSKIYSQKDSSWNRLCLSYSSYSNLTSYEKACSLLSGGSGGIFLSTPPSSFTFFQFCVSSLCSGLFRIQTLKATEDYLLIDVLHVIQWSTVRFSTRLAAVGLHFLFIISAIRRFQCDIFTKICLYGLLLL